MHEGHEVIVQIFFSKYVYYQSLFYLNGFADVQMSLEFRDWVD